MTLTASNTQNHFTLNGSVPSEAIKMSIDNELRATFGDGHYTNNLTVNEQLKPAKWLDKLKGFFGFFKLPGAELTANGDTLILSGTAISLKDGLTEFIGEGVNIKALDIASNVKTANTNALSSLDSLSVNSDAQAILDAMNLQIINFASGSARSTRGPSVTGLNPAVIAWVSSSGESPPSGPLRKSTGADASPGSTSRNGRVPSRSDSTKR